MSVAAQTQWAQHMVTVEELTEITGCVSKKAQIYWFVANGLNPVVNRAGLIVLPRADWEIMKRIPTLRPIFPAMPTIESTGPIFRDHPTVYFLHSKNEVVYVGQTKNLVQRLATHERSDMKWDLATHLHVEKRMLSIVEYEFIERLRPRYNKMGLRRET